MAQDPRTIMAMSDGDLMHWTLAGDVGSYAYGMGKVALEMRLANRQAEAALESAKAAKVAADYTKELASFTRNLAVATWGIVAITLLTQVALILVTLKK